MKKIRTVLFSLLTMIIIVSCDLFVTDPNPLIGCYRFSESAVSDAALYYLAIEENQYFIFVQAGGINSSTPIIFEGVWEMSASHFDFFKSAGTIKLHVTSVHNADNTAGLALSYTENNNINPFTYSWILDGASGIAELVLNSQNQYLCNIAVPGYTISEQEFERATGWNIGEEEPETPDDPGTDDPGTDDPGTDDPGTDDPGTDDPGTDDPDTDDPDTDDPDTDDPDTDDPDTEETPPETEDGQGTEDSNGEAI